MSYKNFHIKIYKGHIKIVFKFMITSATWYCRVLMSSKCAEITKNSCHMVAILISQAALMLIDFFFLSQIHQTVVQARNQRESHHFLVTRIPSASDLEVLFLTYLKLFRLI